LKLDEHVLGKANLFDLAVRTLRFIPDGAGYRVENVALQWGRGVWAGTVRRRSESSQIRVSLDSQTRPECITWAAVAVKRPGHDSTYRRKTLGPFGVDCDLRRWGLKLAEQGGRNGKKRGDRHRTKTGSAVASPVGERRSVRTVAQ